MLVLGLILGFCISANAARPSSLFASEMTKVVSESKTMTLEISINDNILTLENVPTKGYLEIYSIQGVKVKSVNLQECFAGDAYGSCSIDIGKGIYILKAGKVSRKILVR